MPESERMTIERLERNIASFEELVQTILESGEDGFDEAQQALVIRFLESKGYEVNTAQLRPRVLACAGIIGAELGYLSPSEIPRIAPGVLVTETEVDAIVTELKTLAASFKPQSAEAPQRKRKLRNRWLMPRTASLVSRKNRPRGRTAQPLERMIQCCCA